MPVSCHRESSFLWVPELSPREAKIAWLLAIACKAPLASLLVFMLAGSVSGPTTTKSLYITSNRLTPNPSDTNFSSALFA